jgi:hypothetical protein
MSLTRDQETMESMKVKAPLCFQLFSVSLLCPFCVTFFTECCLVV